MDFCCGKHQNIPQMNNQALSISELLLANNEKIKHKTQRTMK